jgi:hypothetical protein
MKTKFLMVFLVCLVGFVLVWTIRQVHASNLALQQFQNRIKDLPTFEHLQIEGWVLDSSNDIQHIKTTVASQTQIKIFSQTLLTCPLSVDHSNTIIGRLSILTCACKYTPTIHIEMRKGSTTEKFFMAGKHGTTVGDGLVLSKGVWTGEFILKACESAGIKLTDNWELAPNQRPYETR